MGLQFDRATHGRVEMADDADLDCATHFALELVGVRIDSAPTAGQIYGLALKGGLDATLTSNYGLWYWNDSGTLKLYGGFWAGGAQRIVSVNLELVVGRFYYVALVNNDTTKDLQLFTGLRPTTGRLSALILQATANHAALSPTVNAAPLFVGCDMTAAGAPQNGSHATISGVRVHGSALTQPTLEARMNVRSQGIHTSLRGCWELDEGRGSVARDTVAMGRVVAGGNDGTLKGGAHWADAPQDVWYGQGFGALTGSPPGPIDPPPALIGFCSHSRQQGVSIVSSDEDPLYPVTRIMSPRGKQTTRTLTLATWTLTWTFRSRQPIGAMLIRNHNLTSGAVIKAMLHSADSWGTPDIDRGVPPTLGTCVILFRRQYGYAFARLEITDAANPAGYLELSAEWLPPYELPTPADAGRLSFQHQDPSTHVPMLHGGRVTRSVATRTDVSVSIPDLTRGQAAYLRAILTESGGGEPVWLCHDARHGLLRGTYGTLRALGSDGLANPQWTHGRVSGIVIEADP